jgi:beta-glucanase (GH16 family)
MKTKMKTVQLIFYLIVMNSCLKGQAPAVDKNWSVTPFMEDQFNNQQFFDNTWLKGAPWGPIPTANESYDLPGNLTLSNDQLKCSVKYEPAEYPVWIYRANSSEYDVVYKHFDYTSNLLFSQNKYSYGYFEMKFKIPLGSCFWPTFWLWTSNPNPKYVHEIDIMEKYPPLNDFQFSTNLHWIDNITGNEVSDKKDYNLSALGYSQGLSQTAYKFAVEWSPKWIYYYINDKCFQIIANDDKVPNHPMSIITGFAIGPGQHCDSSVSFPSVMEIDWIKVFHLDMTGCSSNNYSYSGNFTNYSWGVKKTVTINNGSTIPSNANVTLRASDYTLINGDFTAPLGAEFSILPTNCY